MSFINKSSSRREFVQGIGAGAFGLAAAGHIGGAGLDAAQTANQSCTEKITVLNPLGTAPDVQRKPQARRLDTLEGKTIYFVNDGFPGSDNVLYEAMDWFKARYPKTAVVYRYKSQAGGGGFDAEDPALWEEMNQKADAMVIGVGHLSFCASAVAVLAIDFETKYNKPAVPLVLFDFATQHAEVAFNHGVPKLRSQFIRGPAWGRTREQIRRTTIEGNNPITGKPAMEELVAKLTNPLTDEEKRTDPLKRDQGPAIFTDTHDNLQRLFLEKQWTDFLPVILPTEQKVEEMLKGTSHYPDKALGRMSPNSPSEYWTYTVRTSAINAVMAGCRPEYLPIILAVGSTGMEATNVSDSGWASGLVINGDIRDEIGLNYGIGAIGPYALANTTIGRAWSLLSINGGNCGKAGTTYMGTVGNPVNLINIVIAENEKESPFEPFSVRLGRGYKRGQNIVSLLSGWGILSSKNWKFNDWGTPGTAEGWRGPGDLDFPQIIKDIVNVQDTMFGACVVLCPPIANAVKDAGYDTVEKFTQWLITPPAGEKPHFRNPGQITVIVTGGTNNNYWSMGALGLRHSVEIDQWR
jgi:hypothetical protein